MLAISKSDATNGAETLRRVQTTQMVEVEEKALKGLKDSAARAQGKVLRKAEASETRLHELQKREQETVTRLGKIQEEAQLFEDSVKVTKTLERYGLRDQDFKNLMYLTTRGGNPGMPSQTMEQVKLVLDQYCTLAKLEAEIKGRGETLQKMDSEIGKAEERLATSTKAFADESKRIEDFVENIQASAKKSTDATIATLTRLEALAAKDIDKTLGVATEKTTGSLKEAQTKASGAIGEILKQSREILTDIRATNNDLAGQLGILVKDTYEDLLRQSKIVLEEMQATSREMATQRKAQLDEYGRIQAAAGKLGSQIDRANALLGFENYQGGLKLLDKDQIELLISRIIVWSKAKPWLAKAQFQDVTNRLDIARYLTIQFEVLNWALIILRVGNRGMTRLG
jgi:hypothetical protein